MTQYNNWNINQDSLFYELNELNPNGIIEELGVENLNFMFAVQYGSREVPSFFEGKTTKEVAKHINQLFKQKWNRLSEIIKHENTLPIGFEKETLIDESNTDLSNKNIVNNNSNKVSAFNVDVLIENSGSDDVLEETGDRESSKQHKQTTTSLQSIDFQRKMLENESISKVICQDVASVIVLSVY